MDRRHFLRLGAGACAAARFSPLRAADPARLKVGVISDEISQDVDKALQFLKSYGFRHVEIRSVWRKYFAEADESYVVRLKDVLRRYEMTVPLLDSKYLKTVLPGTKMGKVSHGDFVANNTEFGKQDEVLEASIERAVAIGAPAIRVFSFWRTTNPAEMIEPAAEHLTRAAGKAAKRGIALYVENETSCNVASGREVAALFARCKHPNVFLNFDAANVLGVGGAPYPDDYGLIPPGKIRHCHVKDGRPDGKGKYQWTAVGQGVVRYPELIRALLKDGFDGMLSVETHYSHPEGPAAATRASVDGLLAAIRAA